MDSELPVFPNLIPWYLVRATLDGNGCHNSWRNHRGYQSDHYRDEYYGEGDSEGDDKPLLCRPPENVPSCLRSNLKVIKFVNFQGDDGELKMVEYFLKNAEVLEKLIIQTDGTVDECFDMGAAGLAVATAVGGYDNF
ncbi:hypothetical protein C3L33_12598, partial [Rhododendron williamsianum]